MFHNEFLLNSSVTNYDMMLLNYEIRCYCQCNSIIPQTETVLLQQCLTRWRVSLRYFLASGTAVETREHTTIRIPSDTEILPAAETSKSTLAFPCLHGRSRSSSRQYTLKHSWARSIRRKEFQGRRFTTNVA